MQASADGQWSIGGPGVPGCNFILQASTNLINWVNLATNPSPFAVVDTDAGQYPRRFYRAVLASTTPPGIATQPVSQTAGFGHSVTLTVSTTGSGPFTYQWRRDGANIDGATGSSLTLNGLQLTDAGSYSVVVSSAAGSVTSQAAVLKVAPILSLQLSGQGLTLTWPGEFILQAASSPAGPFADVPGATSLYFYNTLTNAQKFFRLRSP
jgi:hypothetical protein